MTLKFRGLAITIVAIVACFYFKPADAKTSDAIQQANKLYQNGQYQKAADIYENLLPSQVENGHLYYNLGNTYIRLGNNGKAILAYLKAKSLLPRDEDLKANLSFAIYETVDKLDWERVDDGHQLFFWVNHVTFEEHLMLLLIVNLTFWLTMGVWVYQRNRGMDISRKILLGALLVTLTATGLRWHMEAHESFGVVLQEQIQIRSEPIKDRVILFELHEGAVVKIEEKKTPGTKSFCLTGKQDGSP